MVDVEEEGGGCKANVEGGVGSNGGLEAEGVGKRGGCLE